MSSCWALIRIYSCAKTWAEGFSSLRRCIVEGRWSTHLGSLSQRLPCPDSVQGSKLKPEWPFRCYLTWRSGFRKIFPPEYLCKGQNRLNIENLKEDGENGEKKWKDQGAKKRNGKKYSGKQSITNKRWITRTE